MVNYAIEARREEYKLLSEIIRQKDQNSNIILNPDSIRELYEDIELPYENLVSLEPPRFRHEIDVGDGTGGIYTILTLLYAALIYQEEKLKGIEAESKKGRKAQGKPKFVTKDKTQIENYEKGNAEYQDFEQIGNLAGDDSQIDWNEVAKFLPTSKTDKK